MKPIYKYSIIGLTALIVAGGSFAAFYYSIPEPPVGDIDYALASLQQASQSNAKRYSKQKYLTAKAYLDSAMKHWNVQNKRFILNATIIRYHTSQRNRPKMAKSATSKSKELIQKSLLFQVKR